MIPRPLLTLLASAALAAPLPAQSAKLNLRTLSLGSTNFPQLWAMNGTTPVAIPFSAIQPSEPLRLDRSDPLRIFKGKLNEKGLPANPTPALVKLPTDSSILLLGWMVEETPRFFPIPDPFSTSRHDDWLVINTTTRPVAIQIGAKTKPTTVKPSSHSPIRVTAPVNEGAAVIVAIPKEQAWKTIYSTYWPIYPDKRCLVLVVEDGLKTRVKVISDEFKKPAAKEP
jgi:hypothetical protein